MPSYLQPEPTMPFIHIFILWTHSSNICTVLFDKTTMNDYDKAIFCSRSNLPLMVNVFIVLNPASDRHPGWAAWAVSPWRDSPSTLTRAMGCVVSSRIYWGLPEPSGFNCTNHVAKAWNEPLRRGLHHARAATSVGHTCLHPLHWHDCLAWHMQNDFM